MEGSVLVLFLVILLPKSRRLTLIGKIYEPRQVRRDEIRQQPRYCVIGLIENSEGLRHVIGEG